MNSKENIQSDSLKKEEKNVISNDINIININSNILKKENNNIDNNNNKNNNNNFEHNNNNHDNNNNKNTDYNNNDNNNLYNNNTCLISNRKRSTNSNYKIINIDEELEKILNRFAIPEPIIQIRSINDNIYIGDNINQSILKEINYETNIIIFNKKELEFFEKFNKRDILKIVGYEDFSEKFSFHNPFLSDLKKNLYNHNNNITIPYKDNFNDNSFNYKELSIFTLFFNDKNNNDKFLDLNDIKFIENNVINLNFGENPSFYNNFICDNNINNNNKELTEIKKSLNSFFRFKEKSPMIVKFKNYNNSNHNNNFRHYYYSSLGSKKERRILNKKKLRFNKNINNNNNNNNFFNDNINNDNFLIKKDNIKNFKCELCNCVFENPQGLGGHMSRIHRDASIKYKKKKETRNKRTEIRRIIKLAKQIICNKNGINYDEFIKTKEGKKLVQKCITENKKEYRNLRKKLQEKE